jgi:hypothetical protein
VQTPLHIIQLFDRETSRMTSTIQDTVRHLVLAVCVAWLPCRADAQGATDELARPNGRLPVFVDTRMLRESFGDGVAETASGRLGSIVTASDGIAVDFNALLVVVPSLVVLDEERLLQTNPVMTALRVQLTLTATMANKRAANGTRVLTLRGVGASRDAALRNAVASINPSDEDLVGYFARLQEGIVAAFDRDCDELLRQARTSVMQGDEYRGFVMLDGVPVMARTCHARTGAVMDTLVKIIQDRRCDATMQSTQLELSAGRIQAAALRLSSGPTSPACMARTRPIAQDIQARSQQLSGDEKAATESALASLREKAADRAKSIGSGAVAERAERQKLAREAARGGPTPTPDSVW